MRNRFKGAICVYCRVRPASSDDHIFSRKLFHKDHRGDLPKAPACERCNGQKSKLETYLTAVLPMGSRLGGGPDPNVVKRLKNNLKLARELTAALEAPAQVFADGRVGIRTAFPFRARYLEEYLGMVATALAWHHFDVGAESDHCAMFFDMNDPQAAGLDQIFHLNCAQRAYGFLGEGVVEYRAIQAEDDPRLSIWQFRLFGGLLLGYSQSGDDRASSFVVILGRREFLEGLRQDQIAAMLEGGAPAAS